MSGSKIEMNNMLLNTMGAVMSGLSLLLVQYVLLLTV